MSLPKAERCKMQCGGSEGWDKMKDGERQEGEGFEEGGGWPQDTLHPFS